MSEFYIILFLFVVLCLSSSCALVRLPSLSSYFLSIFIHTLGQLFSTFFAQHSF